MENEAPIINKKNISNVIKVALVSLFSLGASLLSGFIIPKILSVENYGYYQTALLYVAYLGIAPLGFFDGIILSYAGKNEDELPKNLFHYFSRVMFVLHLVLSAVFIILGFALFTGPEKWIFLFLGLQLFFGNMVSFFTNISTMTSNFKLFSKISFASSALRFVDLGVIAILYLAKVSWINEAPFYVFLGISLLPNILMFVVYIIRYRQLVFGKTGMSAAEMRQTALHLIKLGFPLLVGNLVITFILECDRQFVQIAFDISTYAVYAFAYSLLGLISKVVSSISTVLFPELKKRDAKAALSQYPTLIGVMSVTVSLLCFGYYAVHGVVLLWLPKYTDSLKIFRVVLAAYLCYSNTVIINQNYYKSSLMNVRFLIISICCLALGIGLNFAAYYLFGTTYSISLATLITLITWFLLTSLPLSKKIVFKDWNNYFYVLLFAIGFSLLSLLDLWLDAILSTVLFALLILLFERGILSHFVQRIRTIQKKGKEVTAEAVETNEHADEQ